MAKLVNICKVIGHSVFSVQFHRVFVLASSHDSQWLSDISATPVTLYAFFNYGRKPGNLEKTHAGHGESIQTVHRKAAKWGINPRSFLRRQCHSCHSCTTRLPRVSCARLVSSR